MNNPLVIRKWCQYYAKCPTPTEFSKGVQGGVVGAFNLALKHAQPEITETNRQLVWGWVLLSEHAVLRPMHSSELSPTEWNSLYRWMGCAWKEEKMRPEFIAEVRAVLNYALTDQKELHKLQADRLPMITMDLICARWERVERQAKLMPAPAVNLPKGVIS